MVKAAQALAERGITVATFDFHLYAGREVGAGPRTGARGIMAGGLR